MTGKTTRPALTLAELELLLDGLERVSMAAKTMDEMEAPRDLTVRLSMAAQNLRAKERHQS